MDIDDLMFELAIRDPNPRWELLLEYVQRYPQHADKLTEFYVDLILGLMGKK